MANKAKKVVREESAADNRQNTVFGWFVSFIRGSADAVQTAAQAGAKAESAFGFMLQAVRFCKGEGGDGKSEFNNFCIAFQDRIACNADNIAIDLGCERGTRVIKEGEGKGRKAYTLTQQWRNAKSQAMQCFPDPSKQNWPGLPTKFAADDDEVVSGRKKVGDDISERALRVKGATLRAANAELTDDPLQTVLKATQDLLREEAKYAVRVLVGERVAIAEQVIALAHSMQAVCQTTVDMDSFNIIIKKLNRNLPACAKLKAAAEQDRLNKMPEKLAGVQEAAARKSAKKAKAA